MMIIICIMMFLVGICILAGILLPVIQVFIAKEETEAIILAINPRMIRHSPGRISIVYFPIFEYYVDGKKYIKESYSGSKKGEIKVGERIKIKYPKNMPEDAFLAKDAGDKVIVGLCVIGVTITLIVVVTSVYIKIALG